MPCLEPATCRISLLHSNGVSPSIFCLGREALRTGLSTSCRIAEMHFPARFFRMAVCLFISGSNVHAEPDPPAASPRYAEEIQPILNHHCIQCHGKNGKVKGKVNLLEIESFADLRADPDLLDELIQALLQEDMPPEDESPLPPELRKRMVETFQAQLYTALRSNRNLAHTPIRRMNRLQYNNAVKALFDLKVEVFALSERMLRQHDNYFQPATGNMPPTMRVGSRPLGKSQMIEPRLAGVAPFPQDLRAEHGFDNRGDHLSLSPLLMEAFLRLSRSVVEAPNFNAKTCGIWSKFFAEPESPGSDLDREIRSRLTAFLTRAFRRPPAADVLNRYAEHALGRMSAGSTFTDAMKEIASATLASPRFLYLYDGAGGSNKGTEPLDSYELASRLSFFLWAGIPDDELLAVAATNGLASPGVLEAQVSRMLKDRKLKGFCDSFPTQWLQLDRIVSSVPDENRFRDFYYAAPNYRTSMDMMLEPLLLFETILVENRSILELIHSDFSYRSVRLQKWYGHEEKGKAGGPVTMQFKRVPVTNRREGGVITTAAVMTMTSGPLRSKPITRGAWMAGVIFNDPPEPPPADVPPLDEHEDEKSKNLTLRERLIAHRERADCAGCHERIDPLGFALENYDAVGRWRDTYANGRQVDSGGKLFRQHAFVNVDEFKDAILAEKDRFTRALAAHLLAFALGREVTANDGLALDEIVAKTASADYRFQDMIHAVIQSRPFVSKSNPAESTTPKTP